MKMQAVALSSQRQKATTIVLCFLLSVRFLDGLLTIEFWGDNQLLFSKLYITVTFALLAFVIWLNKESISNLHIDRFFIIIFIISGALVSLWLWLSLFGFVVGVSIALIFILLETGQLIINVEKKPSILLGIVLGILPIIFIRLFFNEPSIFAQGLSNIMKNGEIVWIVIGYLWGVVYEEMLFRGMLWAFLQGRNFSNGKILVIQALLFWLCHLTLVSRISFWINVPLISLWLGFLVLRYKSLTPSTITHFAYNFIGALMKAAS